MFWKKKTKNCHSISLTGQYLSCVVDVSYNFSNDVARLCMLNRQDR